jgi:hypothetical protein
LGGWLVGGVLVLSSGSEKTLLPMMLLSCKREGEQSVRVCLFVIWWGEQTHHERGEHSNWQQGFWQCSNFTSFIHPTKQTNKQARGASLQAPIAKTRP